MASGWCLVALQVGPSLGFIDHPDRSHLTAHRRPAVPLGGVGVFLAVFVVSGWQGEFDPALFIAASIMLVLGLVDDRIGLSPIFRLVVEVGAGVVLSYADGTRVSGVLESVVAVALVVVAMNAVNLFDGLDGLVGCTALVSVAGLLVAMGGSSASVILPLALAGALIGFLPFNWNPARIFLGDAGSYLLGLLIAYLVLTEADDGVLSVLTLAGVLGVFVIDMVATVIRRALARRPLFEGDRSHVYDQLRDRGWTVPAVVLGSVVAQVLMVGIAIAASRMPLVSGFVLVVVASAIGIGLLARGGFLSVTDV